MTWEDEGGREERQARLGTGFAWGYDQTHSWPEARDAIRDAHTCGIELRVRRSGRLRRAADLTLDAGQSSSASSNPTTQLPSPEAGASGSPYGSAGSDASVNYGNLGDAGNGGEAGQVYDASTTIVAAPPGLAGFAFIINGVVQSPMACPSDNWEFAPPPTSPGQDAAPYPGLCAYSPPCPGLTVILVNTGQVPMAYIARTDWSGPGYRPGVATGEPNELVGVLSPGGRANITSVYVGGIVAELGSANPFSSGKYVSDEGTVPWPAGVSGSGGAAQMWVAQIDVQVACTKANPEW
jgi:hypothetical protein